MLEQQPTLPSSVPPSQSGDRPESLPAAPPEGALPQRRELLTEIPGPRSLALAARRRAAVAGGVGSVAAVYAARAGGGVLVDVDGNSLIDLGSGIAVTSVGNSDPAVVARIAEQAALYTHACFTVTPYEPYVQVCELLNRITPGNHEKRSALFSSGAEAVENAVKIARRATGRDAVIVFDHAYHGRTNLTMAMTSKNNPYKDGFGPFAGEVYRAQMSYPMRDPEGMTGEQAAQRAISQIESQVGARNVACLVIEPIQGEGGFVTPAPGFLPALQAWCTATGVVFVADEIQSGFARTGDLFASDYEGVVPDIITTAKGIAGGMPLAGVTGRAELMDAVPAGGLGGTYAGNPVACAAALGAFETIESQGLVAAAARIGELLSGRLGELAARYPQIGDVRGRGAMMAIEFVRPGTLEPDPAEASRVSAACHRAGVITLTCGTYGNVLRLLPPLVIEESLLMEGLDILGQSLAATPSSNNH